MKPAEVRDWIKVATGIITASFAAGKIAQAGYDYLKSRAIVVERGVQIAENAGNPLEAAAALREAELAAGELMVEAELQGIELELLE